MGSPSNGVWLSQRHERGNITAFRTAATAPGSQLATPPSSSSPNDALQPVPLCRREELHAVVERQHQQQARYPDVSHQATDIAADQASAIATAEPGRTELNEGVAAGVRRRTKQRLVADHAGRARGKLKTKIVPPPGLCSAQILPPYLSMMSRAMDRPSPVPSGLVV
jgi:hypothetical protein